VQAGGGRWQDPARFGHRRRPVGAAGVVIAWAREHHLVLGQVAVAPKSNKITAIPKLLELLDLHGALVTMDAMGCQTAIARQIRDQGGDYLLTVKANQPALRAALQATFEQAFETDYAGLDHDTYTRTERSQGRQEQRTYTIITDPPGFPAQADWLGLRVIGMCYCERRRPGKKVDEELRYFIGSKPPKARYYGNAFRGHWSIENSLHWQLDISFREDDNRVCRRRAAENLAVIRRLALMLLKRHPDRQSIAGKRFTAAMDTDFLEEVLCGKT
jgi:predicted transposase YbfD/YdcC